MIDGAQKILRMYDTLMKSGKFKKRTVKYFSVYQRGFNF